MKKLFGLSMIAGAIAVLLAGSTNIFAQQEQRPGGGGGGGRGNFDPEQMRQRQMERYREQMDVKDDAEWKLIQERIEKVTAARRELGSTGAAFGFGRGGGGRGPGGGGDGAGGGGGRRGFGMDPLPEAEALQKALDAKASGDELKAKMAKLREARKEKEAKLEKAQEDLRKVLSVRQEAVAVVNGLLK